MKNFLVSMAFSLLFWSGCQKVDVGPPASGNPIFSLKGQLDGQPFDWQAGVAEKYMLATFDDSTAGEPRFVADLGQLNSPTENGFPKIVIEFLGESEAANWPLVLKARTVSFAEKNLLLTQKRVLMLENLSQGTAPISSVWSVGGQTSSLFSPTIEFSNLDFEGQISLESTDNTGRKTRQTRFLDLKNEREWSVRLFKQQSQILADTNSPDSVLTFKWSNGSAESFIFIDSTTVQASVVATFSNGKTASAEMWLDPQNPLGSAPAAADFVWQTSIKTDTSTSGGGFQPLTVLVHFYSENGQKFSSNLAIQPSTSNFEIVDVEDFERNEAGILTKKVRVKFNCVLADEKGTSRRMSSFEGVVAVGVPD